MLATTAPVLIARRNVRRLSRPDSLVVIARSPSRVEAGRRAAAQGAPWRNAGGPPNSTAAGRCGPSALPWALPRRGFAATTAEIAVPVVAPILDVKDHEH